MGEANLRCARGETEDAIKLCMEVIRQVCDIFLLHIIYLILLKHYIIFSLIFFSRPQILQSLFKH